MSEWEIAVGNCDWLVQPINEKVKQPIVLARWLTLSYIELISHSK
jgi:hypothetical protein